MRRVCSVLERGEGAKWTAAAHAVGVCTRGANKVKCGSKRRRGGDCVSDRAKGGGQSAGRGYRGREDMRSGRGGERGEHVRRQAGLAQDEPGRALERASWRRDEGTALVEHRREPRRGR